MTSAAPLGGAAHESTDQQVLALREEVAQLKQAVTSHAKVDQAIGVVVAVGELIPAEAWDVLREVSMRTNTKLREVADQLVHWAHTNELDPILRGELERQLRLRRYEKAVPPPPYDEVPAH
ncbi:ANTAR domain-containing protein [Streptomyces aureoverticillatus]|nr:ANTAR domain-containing protein [Streptomyces aureoverticillatus]